MKRKNKGHPASFCTRHLRRRPSALCLSPFFSFLPKAEAVVAKPDLFPFSLSPPPHILPLFGEMARKKGRWDVSDGRQSRSKEGRGISAEVNARARGEKEVPRRKKMLWLPTYIEYLFFHFPSLPSLLPCLLLTLIWAEKKAEKWY